MTDEVDRRADLRNLHEVVDVEAAEAELGEDPSGAPDSQLQAYEARLRSLHQAVVAMEDYKDGLGDS